MNIGFIVWNPFQVVQFANVIRSFQRATILVVDTGDNLNSFNKSWLRSYGARVEYVKQSSIPHIDGAFDAIFFQSPFPFMERLLKTPLISLQYGLAKERHNYGEWRSLADMNLMYGAYSVTRVNHFAPSFAVGNPKFENWGSMNTESLRLATEGRLNLDKRKRTVLYMPTWGELGSFAELKDTLASLNSKYNIIVKMHHNNDARLREWKADAIHSGIKWVFDGAADQLELLNVADVVVSDFSGAIFDATYARVPVLLYQTDVEMKGGVQKFEKSSLEFARGEQIGLVCNNASLFEEQLAEALEYAASLLECAEPLRAELYANVGGDEKTSCELVRIRVGELLNRELPSLTEAQQYVRETVRALRTTQRALRGAQKKISTKRWYFPF